MSVSANLALPFIEAAQAQKHVTHNEALRVLDTLVQLAVLDRDLNDPPGAPAEGECWIVAASPTGAWAGRANHIAAWQDGGWQFSAPRTGWIAYVADEGALAAWNGSAWAGSLGAGRELLAADRTYYVRADGSDANDGLANSPGGAFLSIQKAIDTAVALDLGVHAVTIQAGAGTYAAPISLKSYVGAGPITILGDETTPANVLISVAGATAISAEAVIGKWRLRGMKIVTTGVGHAISASNHSHVEFQHLDFGAMAAGYSHVVSTRGALVNSTGNYMISGSAGSHWLTLAGGQIRTDGGMAITLSGTPAFTTAFATALRTSFQDVGSQTFSGSATGLRYSASLNSVVNTRAVFG